MFVVSFYITYLICSKFCIILHFSLYETKLCSVLCLQFMYDRLEKTNILLYEFPPPQNIILTSPLSLPMTSTNLSTKGILFSPLTIRPLFIITLLTIRYLKLHSPRICNIILHNPQGKLA